MQTTNHEILKNKVPQVTLLFWIVKIMSTTVGETAADFLNFNLGLGLSITSLIIAALLGVCLYVQATRSKYIPSIYWVAVTLISVFGTLFTDNLTDVLNVPLMNSSITFGLLLIGVFIFWHKQESTLSIDAIYSGKREFFYWLAIFITFALGTAVGDLVAEQFGWGYAYAGFIFGGLILLIAITNFIFKSSAVVCFWLAYILTRPLGASLGDLLTQPTNNGGFGINSALINIVFFSVITLIVTYFTVMDYKLKEKNHG